VESSPRSGGVSIMKNIPDVNTAGENMRLLGQNAQHLGSFVVSVGNEPRIDNI